MGIVMPVEIICSECGAEAFLTRDPIYEGLKKVGETLSCSACGFVFPSEEAIPYKEKEAGPQVFTDADRSAKVKVFEAGENKRLCRYCAEYVMNPFMQFCARHKKEVVATDSCGDFRPVDSPKNKHSDLF
jgi:rubredoxin